MASKRSGRPGGGSALRVLTFNIRQDVEVDGENRWANRRDKVVELFRTWLPDVAGLQEPFRHQLDSLLDGLPEYAYVGVGREDGLAAGEFCPVLYRTQRFAALEAGTFWLSEAPEAAGSRSWGCYHPRICSWVRLIDRKTFKGLYVFNTHLDNESQEARERSIPLLHQRILERNAPVPVVLMGDFNAWPDNAAIRQVTAGDSPVPVDAHHAVGGQPRRGTYHGFTGEPEEHPIDYIFLSPEWKIVECRILPDDGLPYLSDHFPLAAILES